jgi:hypothetical protein
MAQLDTQVALVREFFERRNLDLIRGVRETRADIAEQISTKGGTLGPFVDAVTTAFDAFARGLTLLCHLLSGGFRWKLASRFNKLRLVTT